MALSAVLVLLVFTSFCVAGGRAACPPPVTNVMAVAVNTTVTLSWTLPEDHSCQITSTRVIFTPEKGPLINLPVPNNRTITGLKCGTTYTVQIMVESNSVFATGTGPPVTTGACCVPDAPTGVTAESVGATSVRLTWGLPSGFTCISHIFITVTPEGESAVYHDVGQVTEYTIDILTPNTTYVFGVISVADSDRTKVPSEEEVRVLVGGSRNFSATSVNSTSVHLTWEPPAVGCDVGITEYQVTYNYSKCGVTGGGNSQPLGPGELEYTFNGLEEDTEYVFTLTAFGSGEAQTMTSISVRTLTAAPTGVPRSLDRLGNQASNSITITWMDVDCIEQNGPITDYIVQYHTICDNRPQSENTGNVNIYSISNLTANTEYIIQVAAVNENGTGPVSEPIRAATARDPGDPISPAECPSPSSTGTSPSSDGVRLSITRTTVGYAPLATLNMHPKRVMSEQQCWPVAGGVIAVTVVVETVIVTILTTVIWYMWRSISKMKQLHNSSPGMAMIECPAYGEVKPQPAGPPPEAIYEQPQ